jgi:hypothetical protein
MRSPACLALLLFGAAACPALAQDDFEVSYYPLKVGHKWTYRNDKQYQVTILVEARKPVVLEYGATSAKGKAKLNTFVLKVTSGDKVMTEQVGVLAKGFYRFQSTSKEIELPAGVYRFQAAGKDIQPPECFLKLPYAKGDTWDVNCDSEGTAIKGSFVAGEGTWTQPDKSQLPVITVASKNMQVGTQPLEVEYWFADKIGMVYQRVQLGTYSTELKLEKFEPAK